MAGFGRSNSLSINTSGSLFGNQTSQGQQSAGLFGSSTNVSQPPQTSGLFGSTTTQTGGTGGLFGGASTAQASQPPQSAGLFGNAGKPATGSTGGLFGASTQQSQPQQGASLFGGTLGGNTTTQNQTSQSGGLFGGLGQNQNQSNQAKLSLFGASTQQQNPTGGSLFGNTQQNQPQQQTNSLFGGMNTQQNNPLGSSNVLQMNDVSQIKGTHRIGDLHPEIQKQIYQMDELIAMKQVIANRVRETYPGHATSLETIAPDVAYVENKLATVQLGLENDAASIAQLDAIVAKDRQDGELAFRAIINQTLPAQFQYGNPANLSASTKKVDADETSKPVDLVEYFNRRTDDLGKTLETYQAQIREIELHLRTMEAGTFEKQQQLMGARNKQMDDRQQLVEALRAIEAAIVDSAKKVGRVRDQVTTFTLGGATTLL
ncbi:hypothetical protein BU23DRAFT_555414 [Bimuria novae-zelandiae CBS 107.79]|uniref:Nucleoporin Nup54 alpha-helical domain-containing protein n=1 Tax=Bimuria novae-zelandiae CBS 107.79 TaxID=1447943 RepID=A0A6A5V549_9PLEO|nr:hypothetical protein BU23DRAFT_555414 [Bimuria novae-zelandiae CBS 107.79]